jgi:hypothetical protein
MFIPSVITMLCVGGVTFYMRFLVALCKEWKPRQRRAHKESRLLQKMPKVDQKSSKPYPSLAALKISETRLNIDTHEFRRHQA